MAQGSATLLKHRITGPSNQWVNVRLVHQQTGEVRNFTGISSGEWLSDTYYSPMRSGYWDFSLLERENMENIMFKLMPIL